MASILEGFLVRVGFDVDERSHKNLTYTTQKIEERLESIAKASLAAAASFTSAFASEMVKAAHNVANFYDAAVMDNTTIESYKALGRTFEAVGGNANQAQEAVGALAQQLKSVPHFDQQIKMQLGVDVYDAQGRLKDTTAILMEARKALRAMPPEVARVQAEAIGLGGVFDRLVRTDFAEQFVKAQKDIAGVAGNLDEVGRQNFKTWNELVRLLNNVADTAKASVSSFTAGSGFVDWLETINRRMPEVSQNLQELSKSIGREMGENSEEFAKYADKLFGHTLDLFEGAGKTIGGAFTFAIREAKDALLDLGIGLDIIRDEKLGFWDKAKKILFEIPKLRLEHKVKAGIELTEDERKYLANIKAEAPDVVVEPAKAESPDVVGAIDANRRLSDAVRTPKEADTVLVANAPAAMDPKPAETLPAEIRIDQPVIAKPEDVVYNEPKARQEAAQLSQTTVTNNTTNNANRTSSEVRITQNLTIMTNDNPRAIAGVVKDAGKRAFQAFAESAPAF